MNYFLSPNVYLKLLETPSVYNVKTDELYELDAESFEFLRVCSDKGGCPEADSDLLRYCLDEDLLSTSPSGKAHSPFLQSPVPSPRYLELLITDKCNLRCRHCYIGESRSRELSLEEIRALLTEFEELQGLRVMITGGEPLLHSRFDEINEMLPKFALRKVLFTNGILLADDILTRLNVHEIQISIDGLRDAHDSLRGKGSFEKSIDAVRRASEAGFDVSAATMVHSRNIGDFDGLQELLTGLGIKDWTVDVPCISGRLSQNRDFAVDPAQAAQALRYGFGEGLHSGSEGFGCGLHLLSVTADGKVAKCSFYSDRPVGTIQDGLRTCWGRIKPVRLKELTCNCRFLEVCRGGCRYRAELLGNSLGRDLYRCESYGIIEERNPDMKSG